MYTTKPAKRTVIVQLVAEHIAFAITQFNYEMS
jgi:hypothetical protein